MNRVKDFLFQQLKYGFFFRKRLKDIQRFCDLSEHDLLELESQILKSHIANAYKKSSFYKELYDRHGVVLSQIQNREDLKQLPMITKDDIKSKVNNLYIGNKIKHISYTSGTSGSPLKVYYDINCILNEASYNEIFRNNGGHYFGQKVVSLRGVLDRKTMKYFDKFTNTLFLSSFNLNKKNIKFYYKEFQKFQPNAILAYPSSLELLSNLLIDAGLELNVPVIFTSSETLYDYQREKIERVLNTKIYDRYGNAERTISLIQQNSNAIYHEAKLYSINEYQEHSVITTNLMNKNFPLIRYEVNDSIELLRKEIPPVINRIVGRIDDYLITKDGTKIGRMDLVFKGVHNIKFAQIIQNDSDYFIVNIVKAKQYIKRDEDAIRKNIIDRIGGETLFEFKYIGEHDLIKTKRGKFKLVINNI
ncbi:MAG: phenylacetate--CoA ligase family protein [Flavobacteriaceae bacterium]|nr:phenylacetate--CoA ligase family protein [Flavobacteriaceae bacterium]